MILTLERMEHVLLGFVVFITLICLFTAWGMRQARKAVDRMQHDIEELKNRPV